MPPTDQSMTTAAIKRTFERLGETEQARLLEVLASEHAKRLFANDRRDHAVFNKHRKNENRAEPWTVARARLATRAKRRV
jgi:hypothetical protein